MGNKSSGYKFTINHSRAWAWHIGVNFCVEPKNDIDGHRDIYLFICLGKHDFSIGFLHWWKCDDLW